MVEQNGTQFRWNDARNRAALLLAEDELTDIAIAEKVGIGRTTLFYWKQHPDFQARLKQNVADLEATALKFAIAKKRKRVAALDDRWRRLQRIMEERGASPEMADVPGGGTGLLVHQIKVVGTGQNAETVDEYVIDASLLRESREHEKQAAQELKQWVDQSAMEHSGDLNVHNTYADILAAAETDAPDGAEDHESER